MTFEYRHGNVCACGNADNDADMIAESGLGAAVENASQKCLDRADIVIPSNNNDGVAQLIEKILKSDCNNAAVISYK